MMQWWSGLKRIGFGLKQGWLHRVALKDFLKNPHKRLMHLSEITAEKLDAANIAILVLDYDGVLGPHDAAKPLAEVEQWLRQLSQVIGEQRIAILTNKPKANRLLYFTQQFPSIFVVQQVPKKPYPDGLWEIANYKGVPPHRLALIDDRLLTGMLATCLAYTQGWYFCRPYRNFWQHPIKELFFSVLRTVERWGLRAIPPYSHQ